MSAASQSDHFSAAAKVSTKPDDAPLPELIPDSLESIAAYKRYVDEDFQQHCIRSYGFPVEDDSYLLMEYDLLHQIAAIKQLNLDVPKGFMISFKFKKLVKRLEPLSRHSPLIYAVAQEIGKPEVRFYRQIDAEFFLANLILGHFYTLDRELLREIFERHSNIEKLVRVQIGGKKWSRYIVNSVDSVDSDSDSNFDA
jgi:hypothetical protein